MGVRRLGMPLDLRFEIARLMMDSPRDLTGREVYWRLFVHENPFPRVVLFPLLAKVFPRWA